MWTSTFWKDLAERLVKTFAQTLLGGAGLGMPWLQALNVALLAAVLSLLSSLVSGFVKTGPVATASLVPSAGPAGAAGPEVL